MRGAGAAKRPRPRPRALIVERRDEDVASNFTSRFSKSTSGASHFSRPHTRRSERVVSERSNAMLCKHSSSINAFRVNEVRRSQRGGNAAASATRGGEDNGGDDETEDELDKDDDEDKENKDEGSGEGGDARWRSAARVCCVSKHAPLQLTTRNEGERASAWPHAPSIVQETAEDAGADVEEDADSDETGEDEEDGNDEEEAEAEDEEEVQEACRFIAAFLACVVVDDTLFTVCSPFKCNSVRLGCVQSVWSAVRLISPPRPSSRYSR